MKQKLILSIVLVLLFTLLVGCSERKDQTIADGLYLPTSETTEWSSLEFKDGQLLLVHRDSGTISIFDYTFKWDQTYKSYMLSYEVGAGVDRWNITIIDEDTIRFSGTVGTFVRQK